MSGPVGFQSFFLFGDVGERLLSLLGVVVLLGELSFEEDKPKKFNKSKSNSKRKDVRKSNPKPPTLRN